MTNDSNQWPIPPPSGPTTASELYPDTNDYYSSHFKSKGPQTYAEYLASLGATSATEALEAIMRRNRLLKGEKL